MNAAEVVERIMTLPAPEREQAAQAALEAHGYSGEAKAYRERVELIRALGDVGLGPAAANRREAERRRRRR